MDIQQLTMGELGRLEKLVGRSMASFTDEDKPQADVLAGLAYLIKNREDKSFTYDHAQALTLSALQAILNPEGDEDAGES